MRRAELVGLIFPDMLFIKAPPIKKGNWGE